MGKVVWYLLHNLTEMTQMRFRSQRRLFDFLRREGCKFDNNQLAQVNIEPKKGDTYNEDIGELYLENDTTEFCIEALL